MKYFIVSVLLALSIFTRASAETIAIDTVWTKANSPYLIKEGMVIEAGATLTVEPGVEVVADDNQYIEVYGQLILAGTESEPINIKSADPGNIFWGGITVMDGGSLTVNWVNVFDAWDTINLTQATGVIANTNFSNIQNGVYLTDSAISLSKVKFNGVATDAVNSKNSRIEVRDSNFSNIKNTAINLLWTSTLKMTGSVIENSVIGIDAKESSVVSVGDSQIIRPLLALEALYKSTIEFLDSQITDAYGRETVSIYSGSQLKFNRSSITGQLAKRLISFSGASGEITDSVIDGGTEAGVRNAGSVISISNSAIVNYLTLAVYSSVPMIAANNWWGTVDGPGNKVSPPVSVKPWLLMDPREVLAHTPVILIPGTLASYLNQDDEDETEVWLNLKKALASPSDDYLDMLKLDDYGLFRPDQTKIKATDVVRKVSDVDFFAGLIAELINTGYVEGKDLFVFPYDWRPSISQNNLAKKIEEVIQKTGSTKVDIVAHSMGGLLTKYYLYSHGGEKIRKFIDIGTPHLGSPNAFQVLMFGDNLNIKFGWFGLNLEKIKEISQNMTSAYELLPSANHPYYINDAGDFDSDGVRGRLSYEQSKSFMENVGLNENLLDLAPPVQSVIQMVHPQDYGIETHNIVSCGKATLGKFYMLGKQTDEDPGFDVSYISGDGTVPQESAEYLPADQVYYARGVTHAKMPSAYGIRQLVLAILGNEIETFDFNAYPNLLTDNSNCALPGGTAISVHSPVNVHVYDSAGRHVGPDENGDLEVGLSEIAYDILGKNKFIFLPEGESYEVILEATDLGTFSAHQKIIRNGEVIETEYFQDVPITVVGEEFNFDDLVPTATTTGDILNDKVPPEFSLSVNLNTFKLEVQAVDKLSKATLVVTGNLYTATDAYGNVSKMMVNAKKESDQKLTYLVSFPNINPNKIAELVFNRVLDKQGKLQMFKQMIKQDGFAANYNYTDSQFKTLNVLTFFTKDGQVVL